MPSPKAEQAPARGCYDRALSRQARQAEQRERLVAWISETYRAHGEQTRVNDVVQAAGVGRNTFYEYFDGLDHALTYAAQTAAARIYERIVSHIERAPTTLAKLRALPQHWFAEAHASPASMAVLLRNLPGQPCSQAASLFESLLRRALDQTGQVVSTETEVGWEVCASMAAAEASRYAIAGGPHAEHMQSALELLLTRLFR
jgi:AcrR family transcriptional regulator